MKNEPPHAFNGGPLDVWPINVRIVPLTVPNDLIVMGRPPELGIAGFIRRSPDDPADTKDFRPRKLRGPFHRIGLADEDLGIFGSAQVAYEPESRTLGIYHIQVWNAAREVIADFRA